MIQLHSWTLLLLAKSLRRLRLAAALPRSRPARFPLSHLAQFPSRARARRRPNPVTTCQLSPQRSRLNPCPTPSRQPQALSPRNHRLPALLTLDNTVHRQRSHLPCQNRRYLNGPISLRSRAPSRHHPSRLPLSTRLCLPPQLRLRQAINRTRSHPSRTAVPNLRYLPNGHRSLPVRLHGPRGPVQRSQPESHQVRKRDRHLLCPLDRTRARAPASPEALPIMARSARR